MKWTKIIGKKSKNKIKADSQLKNKDLSSKMSQIDLYWDSNIKEYEVDPSWKKHPIYNSEEYQLYRNKWSKISEGKVLTEFPLNIEMEPTYYCNLKCPFVQEL